MTRTPSLSFLLLLSLSLNCLSLCLAAMCPGVRTNQGILDLNSEEKACAEPGSLADLGKSYIWCTGGLELKMNCSPGTRFSMKHKVCTFAYDMDCGVTTSVKTFPNPNPTPANEPAAASDCNSGNCQLPDCFCFGSVPEIKHEELPMFILLSFDDAVTISVYKEVYEEMLVRKSWGIQNPNNCSIRSTFFVSNQNTDYSLVERLYQAGHEIASHGVNHTSDDKTFQEVADEIDGQRRIIAEKTSVPAEEVTGFRSPYLQLFEDHQFDVLSHYNFTYDSSITNVEIIAQRKPLWPFTMDHPIANERCPNRPCPRESHPGVWEVPMNGWVGNNSHSCGMIDGCSIIDSNVTGTFEEYLHFFQSNFETFYKYKVPMHMFTHASMLMKDEDALPALKAFFESLMNDHDDVWFTTPEQLIDWMKYPTNNSDMMVDQRFAC